MKGFSLESKTSGISSLSTSWQDLEARYKSSNEVNTTPRSPRTQLDKMENSEDLARKVLNLARQGASSNSERNWWQGPTCKRGEGSRRLGNQHQAKEATNWAEMGLGRSAQAGRPTPFRGPVGPPDQEPRINQFVIRRRGAEKLEGHHLGDEGRASCLWSP
jgi:hypothetical protein